MAVGRKYDYPPLLPPGRHTMGVEDVKRLFLDAQPYTVERRNAFYRLESFVQAYLVASIRCEIWVDGSFLTEKPDPEDIDVTVILEADVAASLSPVQRQLVDQTSEAAFATGVDSFAYVRRNFDDPLYRDDYLDPAYSWGEQYGLETSEMWLKGFVVLRLGENHVGLRICS